jgi:hypothetical protein
MTDAEIELCRCCGKNRGAPDERPRDWVKTSDGGFWHAVCWQRMAETNQLLESFERPKPVDETP